MIKEKIPESKKEEVEKGLTPKEIKEHLSEIKKKFCTDYKEELGIEFVFPEGISIGDMDISGKTLEEVLNSLMTPLDHYEPPVVQEAVVAEEEKIERKEKPSDIPEWIKGHENLIWKGVHENPLWEIKANKYDDGMHVFYERKGKTLKSGKSKMEQGKELPPVEDVFPSQEWKVVAPIFETYQKFEEKAKKYEERSKLAREGDEGDDWKKKEEFIEGAEARKYMRGIWKEERAFMEGGGEIPKFISNRIKESIEKIKTTTRGFKEKEIDIDALTQKTAEVLSQAFILNRTRYEMSRDVAKVKPDIKEFPTFKRGLSLLSKSLDTQLEENKGLALMIGEAGTGKNEALEYFAAKTNRPFFWFPCGRGMEAVELVAHYEFDSKEGTKRFMTDLAEGIQTPGSVVMIDEVNALKPEVQAILHGLGDSNRRLSYDGFNIPVAEDVLIVIAGNPATYGSAGNIGEALLSRTAGQAMEMEYPALRKGELIQREQQWSASELAQKETEDNELRDYAVDEALILYPLFNEFSGLDDKEFALLWDVVINETTQGARVIEAEANPKLKELLGGESKEHIMSLSTDLRDILRIADDWRKHYEKRAGGFEAIGLSIRDTLAIVKAYRETRDVRKAYLSVMNVFRKNPIEGLDTVLLSLEDLIDKKLGTSEETETAE